jgi:hypothetical protein
MRVFIEARSNLSVGMPIDLLLYERDTLDVRRVRRIDENDDYYRKLQPMGRSPQSYRRQHGRVQRLIVNGRHHARGPRLLFPVHLSITSIAQGWDQRACW